MHIKDKKLIREALNEGMSSGQLFCVCSREHHPGSWVYDCAKVSGSSTDLTTKETTYSFIVAGKPVPALKLSSIEYVQLTTEKIKPRGRPYSAIRRPGVLAAEV